MMMVVVMMRLGAGGGGARAAELINALLNADYLRLRLRAA